MSSARHGEARATQDIDIVIDPTSNQMRDVCSLLSVQGDALDREYLYHWARELGVHELLAQAEADARLR